METLVAAWRFLVLASVFVFPQLFGVLLYYRMKWAPGWVARTVAILAPAVIFYWLGAIFFFAGVREATARGEAGCGMPALFAAFALLTGTVIQVALGLVTHAVLRRRK
jgi:hypothetical protein